MEEAGFTWDNLQMPCFNSIASDGEEESSSITRLDLSWNKIDVLDKGAFSKMRSLKTLIIYGNFLHHISVDAFEGLAVLAGLHLSVRFLRCLKPGIFKHLGELKVMELVRNTQSIHSYYTLFYKIR